MSLVVERARVVRGGRAILDDLSFSLSAGEVLAVLGPNGAGKSTTLRVASGELRPDSGEVRLFGEALATYSERELARRRAVMCQHTTLAFDTPVLDLVLLGRLPHNGGSDGARDHRIAARALSAVGVEHLVDRTSATLSGGEAQRVHLARALAQLWDAPDESLLLLDEPTASLDLRHRGAVMRVARELAARGTAVLWVVHDPNLAARYADRILVLRDGALEAEGAPHEVLTSAVVQRVFGVSCAVLEHPETGGPLVVLLDGDEVGDAVPLGEVG